MKYKYRPSVLAALERHGVMPGDETPPELVREFVNDLYVFEIRSLRARLREGAIPREGYASRVEELRRRYPVLSLPLQFWTET